MKSKFEIEKILSCVISLLISCNLSCSKNTNENSNLTVAQNKTDANSIEWADNFVPSKDWEIVSNESNGRIALVTIDGKTPNGETQTILKLQCPAEKNPVVSLSYIVRGTERIKDFNFDDFEGPDAIAAAKKLVEIQVISPKQKSSFRINTAGWYGSPTDFQFGLQSEERLARLIAKGSTSIKIVVHDYRNFQKTIETTFPAIEPSSEIAKTLKGCRR